MYRRGLQFMILLFVFSLEAATMSILSGFNGIVNTGERGVCCTLDREAILYCHCGQPRLNWTSARGHVLRYWDLSGRTAAAELAG